MSYTVTTFAGTPGVTGSSNNYPGTFDDPYNVLAHPDGTVYIADYLNYKLRKISNGVISDVSSRDALAIAFNTSKTVIYVTSAGKPASLASVNLLTLQRSTLSSIGSSGFGVVADEQNIYVTVPDLKRIEKYSFLTGNVTVFAGSSISQSGFKDDIGTEALFREPFSITLFDGYLYVSDTTNNAIRKIDIVTSAVTTYYSGINNPKGITVDSDGNLYVVSETFKINKINNTTPPTMTLIAGTSSGFLDGDVSVAQFNSPIGISINSYNNLYVGDVGNVLIRKILINDEPVGYIVNGTTVTGWSNSSIPIDKQLDNGITEVDLNAFYGKNYTFNLTSLTFPTSLITIGVSSYSGATGIIGMINLSASTLLEYIGNYAFNGCINLDGALDLDGLTNLQYIGQNAFENCVRLDSLTLPNSITTIGFGAFKNCSQLSGEIDLSGLTSLNTISAQAFRNCSQLTYLTLPNSLTTLGSMTFSGCASLTDIYFQSGCTLQNDTFSLATNATVYVNAGNTFTVGNTTLPFSNTVNPLSSFFSTWRLYDYPYPDTTVSYTDTSSSFTLNYNSSQQVTFYTYSLENGTYEIYINGVRTTSFSQTTDSNNIITFSGYIPPGITSLYLNRNNTNSEEMTLVNTYTGYTFSGTTGEVSVTGWSNASTITKQIGEDSGELDVTAISNDAFANKSFDLTPLTLPITLITIGNSAYDSANGITGTINLSALINLESIGDSAFFDCSGLTGPLELAGLTKLESIGFQAFYGCSQLDSLTLPASLTALGEQVFDGCSGLIGSLDLDGLTSLNTISAQAFQNCSQLTYLTLPTSLTTLRNNAFFSCAGLTDIYFQSGCTLQNDTFSLSTNATVYVNAGNTFTVGNTTGTFSTTVNPLSSFFSTWRLYDYPYPDTTVSYTDTSSSFTLNYNSSQQVTFYTYSLENGTYEIYINGVRNTSFSQTTDSNNRVTFSGRIPAGKTSLYLKKGNTRSAVMSLVDTYVSDICFIKGTLVKTDQGIVPIEKITTQTLNQKPITITKTIHNAPYLVKISAGALGTIPTRDTYMSLKHHILLDRPIMARELVNGDTITEVPYDGKPLYNVLVDTHTTMRVHGMLVETLNPKSKIGRIFKSIPKPTETIPTPERHLFGLSGKAGRKPELLFENRTIVCRKMGMPRT